MKGLVLVQSSQDRVLSTKEICFPQGDKGQGLKDKEKQEIEDKGKGAGVFVQEGQRTASG